MTSVSRPSSRIVFVMQTHGQRRPLIPSYLVVPEKRERHLHRGHRASLGGEEQAEEDGEDSEQTRQSSLILLLFFTFLLSTMPFHHNDAMSLQELIAILRFIIGNIHGKQSLGGGAGNPAGQGVLLRGRDPQRQGAPER